jgi:pSer/pThr/pTyr-binding forkhead associated (FHA) protein
MIKLSLTLSDGTERSVKLTEDLITVGRSEDNLLQIDEVSVSGRHAQLSKAGADYFLKDLGSTNGTRVNGTATTETLLQSGDKVEFGHVASVYLSDAPAGRQPLPESAKAGGSVGSNSARPQNFGSASPYPTHPDQKDPLAIAAMVAGILSIAAMGFAVFQIFSLQPPV